MVIAGPNGDSGNWQSSQAIDAEVIHAVGTVNGTCCRGVPSYGV